MPATSFDAINAWGVYLLASGALVLLLTPQLSDMTRYSREGADWRGVDGIRAAIDSLSPGMKVLVSFGIHGVSDELKLGGHQISCYDGNRTISAPTKWALPNVTMIPSVRYLIGLSHGTVVVTEAV